MFPKKSKFAETRLKVRNSTSASVRDMLVSLEATWKLVNENRLDVSVSASRARKSQSPSGQPGGQKAKYCMDNRYKVYIYSM